MKATLLIATLAAAIAALGYQDSPAPKPVPLVKGADAPVFHLNDHSGNAVTVGGKQESWTVLAFFPKALTPG